MKRRAMFISVLLMAAATTGARAGGTPEQQDACRPDVRRYCHTVKPEAGDDAFLACLQEHRAKLSPKCRNVLETNGV